MYNKYYTVSIIGLEPTRPGYTLWFGLVRTVHPGLVGSRPIIDTVNPFVIIFVHYCPYNCSNVIITRLSRLKRKL